VPEESTPNVPSTGTPFPGVPFLSVIVTTLNEEASIERLLERVVAVYPREIEILVVDGGTDRTGEIVQQFAIAHPGVRYIRNENDRGKGHAVHVGLAAVRAPLVAQVDADLQFLPEELPQLVEPLQAGRADLVLGSRFMRGSTRRPGSTPRIRTMGNWITSAYASVLFGQRMTDILAGMKAWRREVHEAVRLRSEGCSYDAELPVKAVRAGFRVLDVPITTDARQGGVSAIHVVRDGWRILRDLTRYRLGWK
jgi:glycosyltransferase involved in cell wall biosynthesis